MKSWIGDRTKLDTSLFRNGVVKWRGEMAWTSSYNYYGRTDIKSAGRLVLVMYDCDGHHRRFAEFIHLQKVRKIQELDGRYAMDDVKDTSQSSSSD